MDRTVRVVLAALGSVPFVAVVFFSFIFSFGLSEPALAADNLFGRLHSRTNAMLLGVRTLIGTMFVSVPSKEILAVCSRAYAEAGGA